MKKLISVVAPVFNEEGNILKFFERVNLVFEKLAKYELELVFINDGSRDSSELILADLADKDKRVKVINFSRNFGHQMAITAGIDYAQGQAVVIIDSDMQDPPEVITLLLEQWEQGFEVINARRRSRQDGFFKKLTADLFYKLLNTVVANKIPENVGDFRLLDQRAVRILRQIHEKDRYLRGLATWIGFKQGFVEYDREARTAGQTNYTLGKMFNLANNAIYSFSSFPLRLANMAALALFGFVLITLAYMGWVNLMGDEVQGWTSQILVLLVVSMTQMLVLGVISEYVGRIYAQVQNRPLYIVSKTINLEPE